MAYASDGSNFNVSALQCFSELRIAYVHCEPLYICSYKSYIFYMDIIFNAIFQIIKFYPFEKPFFWIIFLRIFYMNVIYQALDFHPERKAIYSERLRCYYLYCYTLFTYCIYLLYFTLCFKSQLFLNSTIMYMSSLKNNSLDVR